MAQTLALFYAFAGLAAVIAATDRATGDARRSLLLLACLPVVLLVVALARWEARWPRAALYGLVVVSVPLTGFAVLVVPGTLTAFSCAALMTFASVNANIFFRPRLAGATLVAAVATDTLALVARGDVVLPAVLVLDTVIVALGLITRRLVVQASGASRDALTGLANRRGLDDALQELVERPGAAFCAALLDLDRFTQVNDTGGHEAGDALLCRVAEVWSHALPPGALLARHGGDEFALLLPGTSGERALALVRRTAALHPDVGMSCGVAERRGGESAAQVMRRADRALYAAKDGGRGRSALDGAVEAPQGPGRPAPSG